MIKMHDAIICGLIIGVLFVMAMCASGYEDEMYEQRMDEIVYQMEVEQWAN